MSTDLISSCLSDIETRLKTVPQVKKETYKVYDGQRLLMLSKESELPCVGVIYEGATPVDESKGGMANTAVFAVVVVCDDSNADALLEVIPMLKETRDVMKLSKAPPGHDWVFVSEFPYDIGVGIAYVQRWSTKVMFTN